MDASHNWHRYRSALSANDNTGNGHAKDSNNIGPRLVFMGVVMSDLQFHVDGNPDSTPNGHINFAKRARFCAILADMERARRTPYFLTEIGDVTEFLSDVMPMTTDAQYEIARVIAEAGEVSRAGGNGGNSSGQSRAQRSKTMLKSIGQRSMRTVSGLLGERSASTDSVQEK